MLFDMPLEQLRIYLPDRREPDDFDTFWQGTLADARRHPLKTIYEPVDLGLRTIDTYDVTFNGYGQQPVKAWLMVPAGIQQPLPCVVEYIGYGGGRGFPTDWLVWSAAGYAHLVVDTRGQGSAWQQGDTPDPEPDGSNPHYPGFMTRGVLNPRTYYYRRVFTDAVRAIDAAKTHPAVDDDRIAATGVSQGGGITLAVAGLEPGVSVVMPDVPFLCHYQRATEITDASPYSEISKYCQIHRDKVDMVFETLSYFDGVNFSARSRAHALFSVGLMDLVCPPSTVFAAYNHFAGPKDIRVYRYNYHEGGAGFQIVEKIKFLDNLWA
jgi:cephalosporin-C deacetylase